MSYSSILTGAIMEGQDMSDPLTKLEKFLVIFPFEMLTFLVIMGALGIMILFIVNTKINTKTKRRRIMKMTKRAKCMREEQFETKADWIRYLRALYLQIRQLKRFVLEKLKEAGIDEVEPGGKTWCMVSYVFCVWYYAMAGVLLNPCFLLVILFLFIFPIPIPWHISFK